MSHRVCLYATNEVGQSAQLVSLLEWGYDVPELLQPLFIGKGKTAKPIFNGRVGGIYVPAAVGVALLERLLAFFALHPAEYIADLAAFELAQEKVRARLYAASLREWLHLDAWDVFNMDEDVGHGAQAKVWLAKLNQRAAAFATALDAESIAELEALKPAWAQSWREYLSRDDVDYGWGLLSSLDDSDPLVPRAFQDGDLQGLHNYRGEVLVPAVYTEIYSFCKEFPLAVVRRPNGLAGYINQQGQEVLACQFQDAFDFVAVGGLAEGEPPQYRAVVEDSAGGWYLIDAHGHACTPIRYEDVVACDEVQEYGWNFAYSYHVQLNGLWGVIDVNGQWIIPPEHARQLLGNQEQQPSVYYAVDEQDQHLAAFNRFGMTLDLSLAKDVQTLDVFEDLLLFKQGKKYGVLDRNGQLLLPAEYSQVHARPDSDVLIVCQAKNGLWGAFCPQRGMVLPCEYQELIVRRGHFVVLKLGKLQGVYSTQRQAWHLPMQECEFHREEGMPLFMHSAAGWQIYHGEQLALYPQVFDEIRLDIYNLPGRPVRQGSHWQLFATVDFTTEMGAPRDLGDEERDILAGRLFENA